MRRPTLDGPVADHLRRVAARLTQGGSGNLCPVAGVGVPPPGGCRGRVEAAISHPATTLRLQLVEPPVGSTQRTLITGFGSDQATPSTAAICRWMIASVTFDDPGNSTSRLMLPGTAALT